MRSFVTAVVVSALVAFTVARTQSVQAQTFTVIHNFTGGVDGGDPQAGVTIRAGGADNLYGTTYTAGSGGGGVVFNLRLVNSTWIYEPLYSFSGGTDGAFPAARVVFSASSVLYGTTALGGDMEGCSGYGCGTVFNLRPPVHACASVLCPWDKRELYQFTGGSDGSTPINGDLTFDQAGNIYGTTAEGGNNNCIGASGCGVAYELSPSNGGWTETALYSF
jgi:hypothetical protein